MKEGKFGLDILEEFFTVRVVGHQNWLPREVVYSPALAVFKARLDKALSNFVYWEVFLPMAGWVVTR